MLKHTTIPLIMVACIIAVSSITGMSFANENSISVIADSPEEGLRELETALSMLENDIIVTMTDVEMEKLDDGKWKVSRSVSVDNNISYFESSYLQKGSGGNHILEILLVVDGKTRSEAETNHVQLINKILENFVGDTVKLTEIDTISNPDETWSVKSIMTIYSHNVNYLLEKDEVLKESGNVVSATVKEWVARESYKNLIPVSVFMVFFLTGAVFFFTKNSPLAFFIFFFIGVGVGWIVLHLITQTFSYILI